MAQPEHLFQCKLFVNGIGSVKCSAVRSLNTADSAAEILPERMMAEVAEIIQPDIGCQLKFQHYIAGKQILYQFLSAGRGQI